MQTQMLREIDKEYHLRRHDGRVETTKSFQQQDDNDKSKDGGSKDGIFDRVGSFIEASNFLNNTDTQKKKVQHTMKHLRPTQSFNMIGVEVFLSYVLNFITLLRRRFPMNRFWLLHTPLVAY